MDEQLLQTWEIHNGLLRAWLEAVPEQSLGAALSPRERTIGEHFAHIHNNRLDWLLPAAPQLAKSVEKIASGKTGREAVCDRGALLKAFQQSEEAISALIRQSLTTGAKMKAFKPHAVAFLGYLFVHEGYHLGKIDFLLRQSGQKMDDKTHYALWHWG